MDNFKRDRSDSLDLLGSSPNQIHELVWDTEHFDTGSNDRQESIEKIHQMLSKKMRDGPGPNSYKRDDGDILDAFYTGNENSGNLDALAGSFGAGSYGLSDNLDLHANDFPFARKGGVDGGFFAMDDVGTDQLSNSFKEACSFGNSEPSMPPFASSPMLSVQPQSSQPPHSQAHLPQNQISSLSASSANNKAKKVSNVHVLPTSAASAVAGQSVMDHTAMGHAKVLTGGPKATSAAAMLGGNVPSSAAMAAALPAVSAITAASMLEDSTERLSHKEVEQRRREKAKQYFDELRALLPCGADSKFDKNTILQNTIAMIKQLQAELEHHKEVKLGTKGRPPTQPSSNDFKQSFDITRQPLCFCGLDGCIWESNAAFCNLLGYSKQEIHGLSLLNNTAPCDSDASSQHWQRLISSGMCNSAFYCHLIRKDNQQLMVNMDLNLLHKRNQPYCFLVATNPTQ